MCSLEVDPKRLERHVRKLCEEFFPRDAFHPESLDRAAAWIRSQLEESGARVSEQPFPVEGQSYRNLVASFGPETVERVVVGAHYDVWGELPGADDNASGVAGLIELAHLLAVAPLSARVELVAFTLEEPPAFGSAAMGSAVHARSLREANARVRAMLSLEMIGCFSDQPGSQKFRCRCCGSSIRVAAASWRSRADSRSSACSSASGLRCGRRRRCRYARSPRPGASSASTSPTTSAIGTRAIPRLWSRTPRSSATSATTPLPTRRTPSTTREWQRSCAASVRQWST